MIVYENQWSTYEEYGSVMITEIPLSDLFEVVHEGYNVYNGKYKEVEILDYQQVYDVIDEWENMEMPVILG